MGTDVSAHAEHMALASPGAGHARLEPFVGSFRADVNVFTAPGADPMRSTGTMVNSWQLGGRYLKQDYTSDDGSMRGIGYWGFNNASGEYEAVWMDVMSTIMMTTRGTCDHSGMVFTATGTIPGPAGDGSTTKLRTVATVISDDEHRYEMYIACGDEPEFKTLEILYTRKR